MAERNFEVKLTATAQSVYEKIFLEAQPHILKGEDSHPKVKLLRLVDECIDVIIPHDPLARDRALAGQLSNIFRVSKGRIRICYVASLKRLEIVVLYISDTLRKEGDKHDPYTIFSALVMSGEFDEVFGQLGIRRPQRRSSERVRLH